MKKILLSVLSGVLFVPAFAQTRIDMQAHIGSAEANMAYSAYVAKQNAYYTGRYCADSLPSLKGDELFARLNELMGQTIDMSGKSYNSLRYEYVHVDRDLNNAANIIGYYDGRSMKGTWDSGNTYNREHTWPQSKGADKSIPMGHDMQSVRPTSTAVNSDRGNTPYGETGNYYDPDDVKINNPDYKKSNNGSYRGDAARIILYDYIVYGERAGHKNKMYNGNAQLLSKLGTDGVFESIDVMVRWSEADSVSLTEMVRNDGAQDYQGNRNPFIDFPQLVRRLLLPETVTNPITGIESNREEEKAKKIIRDGRVYIVRGDRIYTILGL